MKKYTWNKKIVLQFFISLVIGLVALQVSNWLDLKYGEKFNTNDNMRFTWQFFYVLTWVSLIYCVTRFLKIFPKQLKVDMFNAVAFLFKKAGEGLNKAYYAIRHALGIPDPPKRTKARDERSFIFDMEENDLVRRFRNLGGGLKWKDLKDNADKIRFIYIKYINKLMKKGYKFSTILTPMETLTKWKMEGDESAYMFPLYTDARYSGGRRPITDDEVERSSKYMKVNAKIGE